MPQNVFVGPIAEFYDATSTEMYEPTVLDPAVDFLADLNERVGGGRALELGIATGRVGLPHCGRMTPVDSELPETMDELIELIDTMPGAFRGESQLGYWGGVTEGADAWSVRVEADIEGTDVLSDGQ